LLRTKPENAAQGIECQKTSEYTEIPLGYNSQTSKDTGKLCLQAEHFLVKSDNQPEKRENLFS